MLDEKSTETRGKIYSDDPEKILIVDDPVHPLYDKQGIEEPVNERLVRNIRYHGRVLQPILCKREGDKVVVIFGRQRVKACREANKEILKEGGEIIRIPYLIDRTKDSVDAMVSENEFRRDVNPLERAEKAARMQQAGRSEDQIAAAFGVTKQAVSNWLKLPDCCAKVKRAVESGLIKATTASEFAGLAVADQEEKLEKLLDKTTGKPTVAKVRKLKERQQGLFPQPTRKEIEAECLSENTPKDAKDALTWVLGKGKKPW